MDICIYTYRYVYVYISINISIHIYPRICIYIYMGTNIYFSMTCPSGPPWWVPLSRGVPNGMVWLAGLAELRREMAVQMSFDNHHKQMWVQSIGHTIYNVDVQK